MLAICLLIFIGSVIAKKISDSQPKQMVVQDVQLEDVKTPEKKDEPPPPPPPPKEPPKVEVTKFTPPKIVKDQEVKPEEKPPEQEKLEDTKIGAFNQEGDKSDVVAPPVEEKGTGQVAAPKTDNEDYDKVFTSVEIGAKFKGQDFAKFEQTHINANVPTDNGAPQGSYIVRVTFTIDKTGNVSDIVIAQDPGYGCADEVKRVLNNTSGQWTAAQQNGKPVIFRQTQNVRFEVADQ